METAQASVAAFVAGVTAGTCGLEQATAPFIAVRELPYATDAAATAADLVVCGRGNCVAKAELLCQGLHLLGYEARQVCWLYRLPPWPPEVALVPRQLDLHTAAEMHSGTRWLLLDATHDERLARGGFVVNRWDGRSATTPAYPPQSPLWRVGVDDDAIAAARASLTALWQAKPEADLLIATRRYRDAFNRWLDELRGDALDSQY